MTRRRKILTPAMRESLLRAIAAYPEPIRSSSAGERVTLAALHRKNLVTRRAWRVGRNERDSAFEYTAAAEIVAAYEAEQIRREVLA